MATTHLILLLEASKINKNCFQILEKLSNMTHIHIQVPYFTNKIIEILLKHVDTLKSLFLVLERTYSAAIFDGVKLDSQKLLEISKFVHLEKIHFKRKDLPIEDDIIFNVRRIVLRLISLN